MPLQNRDEKETPKLHGVNLAIDSTKLQFGWFATLTNWIPAYRLKLKKKRGVDSVPAAAEMVISNPCVTCTSDPAPFTLDALCCYDKLGYGDLTGNDAGSLSYVATDESWWSTESKMSGFGSGPYPISTPSQNWYLMAPNNGASDTFPYDCTVVDVTASAVSGGAPITGGTEQYATQTAQAGVSGHSDEKSYLLNIYNMTPGFTITPTHFTDSVVYFGQSTGASYLRQSFNALWADVWAKSGGWFYSIVHGTSPGAWIGGWPIPSPTGSYETTLVTVATAIPGWDISTHDPSLIKAIHYSDTYLYLLVAPIPTVSTKYRVYQLNKSSFAYVTHWDLNLTAFDLYTMNFFVASDDIIFLLADTVSGTPFSIGYLKTSTGTTTLLGTIAHQCTPAYSAVGVTSFHYRNGYFYISAGGAGSFGEANILKLGRLMCADNTILPWSPPV